ncbi:diguanylate cyclase [Halomonas sp. HP20-15]|uniref:sensor domain-containing diguanylate cyclase n=1 Tax=Halomonas sp. HP20-15 TaxID=3085901 RepID=UPI002982A619|nr:diguanylate cyclase [Halomonas sp. HP20-15]MDW5377782.1 diguanylate cyclase [Halomonas sp. HP20-15]
MSRSPLSLPSLTLALCWLALLCLTTSPAHGAIAIADAPRELNLSPRVSLLEDAERIYDIDALLTGGERLPWRPSRQETLNFSFSESAWWVRFELTNDTSAPARRLLELAMPLHDYLDAWVADPAGTIVKSWRTGDRRAFGSRPVVHRTFVLPISLPPGETRSVILRLDSHDGLFDATPLYLMDDAGFLAKAQRELMAFSLYFGALLALLAYNFLLYLALREHTLLLYAAYLGTFFVLMFTARGFAFQYWWPQWPTFNNQLVPLNIGLFALTLTLFSDSYLNLRRHVPRLSRGLQGLAALCLLSALPALWGHYAWVFRVMIPGFIVLSTLWLGVAVWRSCRGEVLARIYLVAWCVLLVGISLYFLRVAGVLPYNVVTEYAVQVGSGLEFMLLSLGLAWKINQLKNDKLSAERATHDMQRIANQRLEEQVVARTRELERANRKLASLARTDPLTGLFNRRQFGARLEAELEYRRCTGRPLLFAVMDIDAFKAYNDTYGHQAGDAVLVRVAELLTERFQRPGDQLFRLGGEEFGLLLEADSCEAGYQELERFRESLERLAIAHRASELGVVTASFGLVACEDFACIVDADSLYLQADQAMYEAKARQRNRIVTRHFCAQDSSERA